MNRRPIVALALAEIVSLAGTRLSMIAIPWLVLSTTGDPVLTGVVVFAEMLPHVVAKALGGPLIDRLGARRISITADLFSMAAIALVPLLHFAGLLRFELLLPIVAVLGALRGPADASKQSMVPAIAALAGLPLERITGIMGVIDRLASAIGAAAAGALVAAIGPAPAIIVNVFACGLAALIVAFALPRLRPVDSGAGPQSYFADLLEGWRFLRGDAVLVGFAVMIAITNMLDQAFAAVLLPVWASIAHDATLLGLLLSVFAAASIAGSAIATFAAERLPRLVVYTIAFLVCGAPRYAVFAIDAQLPAIFMVLATAGFAAGFLNPIISAVMFERIPPALIGRVSSLSGALTWVLIPFGGLLGGALIAAFGLPAAFTICGIVYFGATILPLALPGFRGMAVRPSVA